MSNTSEHRHGPDRRQTARGGRRTGDTGDFAPLVLLIGNDGPVIGMAEAVLAKLRFAVTTSKSVDDAMKVMESLQPDIVVAEGEAAGRFREAPQAPAVVVMTEAMRQDPEVLIPAIRETLRSRVPR